MTYKPSDFDTLDCTYCNQPVPPKSVSAGPTVAYKCDCGTSWRINKSGEMTHWREPPIEPFTVNFIGWESGPADESMRDALARNSYKNRAERRAASGQT